MIHIFKTDRTFSCIDKKSACYGRINSDIETNEAFPDRETNPTDFDKLEGYNPNRPRICSPKQQQDQIQREVSR